MAQACFPHPEQGFAFAVAGAVASAVVVRLAGAPQCNPLF